MFESREPIVEEERLLVSLSGEVAPVSVSAAGPGLYRVEDSLRFGFWADQEYGEEPGIGWLLEVEELADRRLLVKRAFADAAMETLQWAALPEGFSKSAPFRSYAQRIAELGTVRE